MDFLATGNRQLATLTNMRLVIGLGNPGREYVGTRHNVGFDAVDDLARRLGWVSNASDFDRRARSSFDALVFAGVVNRVSGEPEKVLLIKPTTFMNLSGRTVQGAMAFHKLSPADIMVVLDDHALPCGKIRIRAGGSDGGHNGLKDIARALGTTDYPRLRIGIDAPPDRVPGRDYVLGRFTDEQRKLLNPAIGRATGAIVTWIDTGLTEAMNRFNVKE